MEPVIKSHFVVAAGVTTHYRYVDLNYSGLPSLEPHRPHPNHGASPTFIAVHGLGCSSDAWVPALRELGRAGIYARVLAPDLPGSGRSDKRHKVFSINEVSDWLAAFMEELNVPSADIGGHSLGCQAAMALARNHPERVHSLTLIGPTTGNTLEGFWRYAAGLAAGAFYEPVAYTMCLASMYSEMGIVRYLKTVRKMLQDKPLSETSEIRQPCLILRGEHDTIVPHRVAVDLAGALPVAEFREMKHCAHAIQFGKPREFVQELERFLSLYGDLSATPANGDVMQLAGTRK